MKWGVVVPTCRPDSLTEFLHAWSKHFGTRDVRLFTVRDEPPWQGIPEFIPRRTDMIRSWGFYLAWKAGCDLILSLDDDVRPATDNIFEEYEREFGRGRPCVPYLSVGAIAHSRHEMRGFPYEGRDADVVVQYGGWHGVYDFDAVTTLAHRPGNGIFPSCAVPVPKGCAVTTCAMNFAFDARWTPIMWQLPLYDGRFNRFGDIWSGLIQKRVLDACGKVMLVNGFASVRHQRASNVYANIAREGPGLGPNEELWAAIEPGTTGRDQAFLEVTDLFAAFFEKRGDRDYARHFRDARDRWLNLFS